MQKGEHYELCIETISQALKNFFKKINLSFINVNVNAGIQFNDKQNK